MTQKNFQNLSQNPLAGAGVNLSLTTAKGVSGVQTGRCCPPRIGSNKIGIVGVLGRPLAEITNREGMRGRETMPGDEQPPHNFERRAVR